MSQQINIDAAVAELFVNQDGTRADHVEICCWNQVMNIAENDFESGYNDRTQASLVEEARNLLDPCCSC